MAYRDRPPLCPRCSVELTRRQRRDIWRCANCKGLHIARSELERRLRLLALSEDIIQYTLRPFRGKGSALACPACLRQMSPVVMGGVELDRCEVDDQIWFDATKLERLFDLADQTHASRRGWLARLRAHLFAS